MKRNRHSFQSSRTSSSMASISEYGEHRQPQRPSPIDETSLSIMLPPTPTPEPSDSGTVIYRGPINQGSSANRKNGPSPSVSLPSSSHRGAVQRPPTPRPSTPVKVPPKRGGNQPRRSQSLQHHRSRYNYHHQHQKQQKKNKKEHRDDEDSAGSMCLLVYGLMASTMIAITFVVAVIVRAKQHCEDQWDERLRYLGSLTMSQHSTRGFRPKPPTTTPFDISQRDPNRPWLHSKLPPTLTPLHYNLELTPHFYSHDESVSFEGKVIIEMKVNAPTHFIVLHAVKLNITAAKLGFIDICLKDALEPERHLNFENTELFPEDGHYDLNIKRTFFYEPFEFFVIELNDRLEAGRPIAAALRFNGKTDKNGSFRKLTSNSSMLATFQNQGAARRAFPCFEEPYFKVHWTLTLKHRPSVSALSNMPVGVTETAWSKGQTQDSRISMQTSFSKSSVPMATTSIVFALGPFWHSVCQNETLMPTQPNICLWHSDDSFLTGSENVTSYILGTVARELKWLRLFFAQNYPLTKIDLLVNPESFDGLGIIGVEPSSLDLNEASNDEDKALVEARLTNVLAKQYFGHVVTFEERWPIEGLAAFLEGPGAWSLREHWLASGQNYHGFLPSRVQQFYKQQDRQITVSEARQITAMLVEAMGMPRFRDGIRTFLDKFRHRTAKVEDFLGLLSVVTGTNVDHRSNLAGWWLPSGGIRLINVTYRCTDVKVVLVNQEHLTVPQWFPLDETGTKIQGNRLSVPIAVGSPANTHKRLRFYWLKPNETDNIALTLADDQKPAGSTLLNFNRIAPVIVSYDVETWDSFARLLFSNINSFDPEDRAQLLDDAFELARLGHLNYEIAFKLCRFMAFETDERPWRVFSSHVTFLLHMLSQPQSQHFTMIQSLVQALLRSARYRTLEALNKQSSEKDDIWNPAMKTLLEQADLGLVQLRSVREVDCFSKYFRRDVMTDDFRRQLRRPIFTAFMLANDNEIALHELEKLSDRSKAGVRRDVRFAVAKTQQSWMLIRELNRVFLNRDRNDTTAFEDFLMVGSFACYSPQSRQFVWLWVRENYDSLTRVIPAALHERFAIWIFDIASYFNSPALYEEFKEFAVHVERTLNASRVEKIIQHRNFILTRIRFNAYWMLQQRQNAEQALTKQFDFIRTLADAPVVC